jgi:hypothetical protein
MSNVQIIDVITKIKSFQQMRNFLFIKFPDTFTVSGKNWNLKLLGFIKAVMRNRNPITCE